MAVAAGALLAGCGIGSVSVYSLGKVPSGAAVVDGDGDGKPDSAVARARARHRRGVGAIRRRVARLRRPVCRPGGCDLAERRLLRSAAMDELLP